MILGLTTKEIEMSVEVLVTTMHATDYSLLERMHIQTNVIIANQADKYDYEESTIENKRVVFITTNTRGLSRNRNVALQHISGDIILFCDDDCILPNDYERIIIDEFHNHPKANAIKFYCESSNPERPLSFKKPKAFKKASVHNALSAGVVVLAIKRIVLERGNYRFNESVGAGTKYYCGEDSIFIKQLIDDNTGLYLSPTSMGIVRQEGSSWFSGYNEQFFVVSGYLYGLLYKKMAIIAAIRRAIRMRKKVNYSVRTLVRYMHKGIIESRIL